MMEGDLLRDDDTAVPPSHPISLELFAKLSTGSASPEEVTRFLLPHLMETCPSCRALYGRLQEIKGELGHFDELVALLESQAAPDLAAALASLPPAEQLRAAETDETFHTWGLCVYLIQQSKEACLSEPRRAAELAILAVRIALALPPESYHPEWVRDLQARAFAYLANALKVAGELTAADLAFADAERRFTWQSPLIEAELLSMKSSLRREQRRYTEALHAAVESLKIYRDLGAAGSAGLPAPSGEDLSGDRKSGERLRGAPPGGSRGRLGSRFSPLLPGPGQPRYLLGRNRPEEVPEDSRGTSGGCPGRDAPVLYHRPSRCRDVGASPTPQLPEPDELDARPPLNGGRQCAGTC